MKNRSPRRRNLLSIRIFSVVLLLLVLAFGVWKYKSGYYSDPVLSLCINEVCAINPGTETESGITYEDYIELYNPTRETVSLDGLFLSDDPKEPMRGPLSGTIEPGGLLRIYAVNNGKEAPGGSLSVPFGISGDEALLLSRITESKNQSLDARSIDSVYVPASLTAGAVYARTEDGGSVFSEMRPSPALSNNDAGLVLSPPVILTESGFYQEGDLVELSADRGLSIRYTLDGSEPTEDSPLYTGPIVLSDASALPNTGSARADITSEDRAYLPPSSSVDKAVVLRASSFARDGSHSNPVTSTYFVGFDKKEGYEDAVMLSLVTDPDNLFSGEKGIYVRGDLYESSLSDGLIYSSLPWIELMDYTQYYLRGMEAERPVHMEIFSPYGDTVLSQDCGIRIRGNESRSFPQKSFTLFSRKRYESEAFPPVLFDTPTAYQSLILNNSKSLKKVFFFSLVEDRSAAVQHHVPCQVFLNGEYWGMYYLMERYSSEYLEGHYGTDPEDSLLIKDTRYVQDGDPEGASRYKELRSYLEQEDLSDPAVYDRLLEMMDMQSFIDWMCTNIYIANTDTKPLENNVFTWQNQAEGSDGRWRWMLYDLDDSLAVGTELEHSNSWEMDSFVDHAGYAPNGFLDDEPMPALMENEEFRQQFVTTFLDMANENFRSDRVLALLDETEQLYSPWAEKSWERWNTNPQDTPFSVQAEELRSFFENRFDSIVPCLAEHFSLEGDLVTLTLSAEQAEGGSVTLNTLSPSLAEGPWQGRYYTDYPAVLTAEALDGYSFAGWKLEGGTLLSGDESSPEIQVQLTGDASVCAVFEKN